MKYIQNFPRAFLDSYRGLWGRSKILGVGATVLLLCLCGGLCVEGLALLAPSKPVTQRAVPAPVTPTRTRVSPSPSPTAMPSPVPDTATPQVLATLAPRTVPTVAVTGKYVASSDRRSVYYYCVTDDGWRALKPENLIWNDDPAHFEALGLKLHAPCP